MTRVLRQFFDRALNVRPEEANKTALAFLYLVSAIGAFITLTPRRPAQRRPG